MKSRTKSTKSKSAVTVPTAPLLVNPGMARMILAGRIVKATEGANVELLNAAYSALNGGNSPANPADVHREIGRIVARTEYGGDSPKAQPPEMDIASASTFNGANGVAFTQAPPAPIESELSILSSQLDRAHEKVSQLEALIGSILAPQPPANPNTTCGAQPRPPYGALASILEQRNNEAGRIGDRLQELIDRVQLSGRY